MAPDQADGTTPPDLRKRLGKMFLPLLGVTGSLVVVSLIYFGYDIVKGKVSPCESIFQQTSAGLSTKITFLETEGELKLGPEKVAELGERAQMAALNLKTCCTVLDAGRLDPEQFLQCKANARTYDARLEDVTAIVRAALPAANATSVPASSSTTPPAPPAGQTLETAVAAAESASRDFNDQVARVVTARGLTSLETAPTAHLALEAAEREPNDDILNANLLDPGKQVKAAVGAAKDSDYFTFTTPPAYRDWIRIEVQNQSTTLEPRIELFDAAKTSLGVASNSTAGGDAAYEFVAPPATKFSVRVSSYYGSATGVYAVKIEPKKAYDAFEPNDGILTAHRIAEGEPIKASIMDKDDVDYYSIAGTGAERQMTVTITNGSTTLHPRVAVYDAAKTDLGVTQNTTAGGDLTYSFKAPKGPVYLRVSDYYAQTGGDYTLTIAPQ